jgi:hypothetical protein
MIAAPGDQVCGLHRSSDLREDLCIMGATATDLAKEKNVRNVQTICDTAVEIFDAYAAWLSEPLLRDGSQ